MGTDANWTEHILAETGATAADQDGYKQLSANAAKGTAIVTAVHGGWDYAVTVTDYLSISYDPPTMVVSLYSLSRMAEALAESERFGLSLLASGQTAIADALGQPGTPLVGLLGQIPHVRREPGAPALIDGAISWFELRRTAMHEVATHTLFIGEVTAMGRAAGYGATPLVRFRSGYLSG